MAKKKVGDDGKKEPLRGRAGILADTTTDGTKRALGLKGSKLRKFWADFNALGHALGAREWQYARTMPWNPHWYTRRVNWDDDGLFKWVVTELRLRGYRAKFGKETYTQLNLNDHFYWTMGNLMDWPDDDPLTPGTRMTSIINRKHIYGASGYTPLFDTREWDSRWLARAVVETVFGHIGDLTNLRVLDVGCGDGHSLPFMETAGEYLGIDPSLRMLNRLRYWWPWHAVICTPLISLSTTTLFDRVLALFGTGDYLSAEEIARIPLLLVPGGVAWLCFSTLEPGEHDLTGWEQIDVGGGFTLCRYQA